MVESDLFPLDELPYENRRAMCLVLGLNIAFPATLSAPVLWLFMGTEEKVLNPSSVRKLERHTASLAP